MALRRWEAVPSDLLTSAQREELGQYRTDFKSWQRMLVAVQKQHNVSSTTLGENTFDYRDWQELSMVERGSDYFAHVLLGPLAQSQYYDLEQAKIMHAPDGYSVLTLS